MAQNKAGKVSNITMGASRGGAKDHGPGKKGGAVKGLAESARGGGAVVIREIPRLVREIP